MAKVKINNLYKYFGKTIAVDNLSIEINDKELMVFVGPSGCGKTTTLNCIAGLEAPNSGSIFFNGVDVTEVPPHQRNVAMIFQSSLLYPHLTGRKNIAMSLQKSKLGKEEIAKRIEEVSATVNIEPVIDKLPAHMSGGERQRVAVAKAIIRNPSVFLMDEPLANLDAALRELLRTEISVLQKRIETTMILVTHDQVEAMTMGDRIAVMSKGKFQQIGTPDEVYKKPVNTFVAQFIGSPPMHLFHGELQRDGDHLKLKHREFSLTLSKKHHDALDRMKGKNRVILGIRPHNMIIVGEQRPQTFKAHIYATEQMGKENVVIIIGKNGDKLKVITPPQIRWRRNDTVWVGIKEEHALLFDEESTENIYKIE